MTTIYTLTRLKPGVKARIVRTTDKELLGKKVRVIGRYCVDQWHVEPIGRWTFPDGSRRATAQTECLEKVWF